MISLYWQVTHYKSSFEYCFLGVPKHTIVSVSTHGCIHSKAERSMFKIGMEAMLSELEPSSVIVHGYMPDDIFGDFQNCVDLHRYPSDFETAHAKGGA